MGATLKDIRDQLLHDLRGLEHLVTAYLTFEFDPVRPVKIHMWSLLDARDDENENTLAEVEQKLMMCFPTLRFDFTSVHLQGRDPRQFIPKGAYPVRVRRSDPIIIQHFAEALSAAGDAKP